MTAATDQTTTSSARRSARMLSARKLSAPGVVALTALALFLSSGLLRAEDNLGKETFLAQKCNLCHGIEAAGIEAKTQSEKMAGGDLSRAITEETREEARSYVLRESTRDDKEHKKEFKGTDEELQAIFDWLAELAATAKAES